MSFDRRRSSVRPALALATVLQAMQEAAHLLEHSEIDAALLRAQFADRCRDAGVEPISPESFDVAVQRLDPEGWRRLAALAAMWTHPEIEIVVTPIVRRRGAAAIIADVLTVVRAKQLLTMTLLRMSPLRVEELARAWLDVIGIAIAGESAANSAAALERLDYERLLAQAEQAREAAEARMAQLKEAREAEDMLRTARRGKV
jgi:hypothetical protein